MKLNSFRSWGQKKAQEKKKKWLVAKHKRKFFLFSFLSLNTITNTQRRRRRRRRRWLRMVLHLGKTGSRRIADGGTAAPFDDHRVWPKKLKTIKNRLCHLTGSWSFGHPLQPSSPLLISPHPSLLWSLCTSSSSFVQSDAIRAKVQTTQCQAAVRSVGHLSCRRHEKIWKALFNGCDTY